MKLKLIVTTLSLVIGSSLSALAVAAPHKVATHEAKGALSAEPQSKALQEIFNEHWEFTLKIRPELASMLGDKRFNDQLTDFSDQAFANEHLVNSQFLMRLLRINVKGLSEQEQLSHRLFKMQLQEAIAGQRFPARQMQLWQNSGLHLETAELVGMLSFANLKDYEDYIARLNKYPVLFDQHIAQLRKGIQSKWMPPQFLIEKIARQCEELAAMDVATSPFTQALKQFPSTISKEEQARISASMTAAVKDKLLPSYKKLAEFVRNEYLPHGRKHEGIWSVPNGAQYYLYKANSSTTTTMKPEQIHQIGLKEVARIEAQMLGVAKKLGFADLKSFNASILKNPDLHPKSRQAILDLYEKYTAQMEAQLPKMFGRLPKAKMKIMPVEEFREKEAPGAFYNSPALDGSRPGHVMVNTGDFENRLTLSVETTTLHEGYPGHHLQVALAQEVEGVPKFRQNIDYIAFSEGWALYSERLGLELDFFKDPYSYYGHLQDEMLRAIRLVVDTGLHYKKWNRQQVVDFFRNHSGIEEVEIQSETDRYIAWPGQALGYKIGQLKILELRAYASKALGSKFDIRGFHDEVLGSGAVPMQVLEERIKAWVVKQKGSKLGK
jgi:uncharacterized protein (DUF885 family)